MNKTKFKNICFSIGLLENYKDSDSYRLPIKPFCTVAVYSLAFGYKIAEIDEYNNIYMGIWNLSCEDDNILKKLYNLELYIKKYYINEKINHINTLFK